MSTTTVDGTAVEFTLCHAANLLAFARAGELGLSGAGAPAELDADPNIIARVKELRGKIAQMAGMCQEWSNVDEESPMTPMVVLVSEATDPDAHIQSRLFLDNKCHTSMAGTGGVATAACSRIPGTIINQLMSPQGLKERVLNIQHPLGVMPIAVGTDPLDIAPNSLPNFTNLSILRTSRRILDGELRIPQDFVENMESQSIVNGHTCNGNA